MSLEAVSRRVLAAFKGARTSPMLLRALSHPLTGSEIEDACSAMFGPNSVWVGAYDTLADELAREVAAGGDMRSWLAARPAAAAIVLYRWTENYGHWFTVFLGARGKIEFFDSTGHAPDTLQRLQTPQQAAQLGQLHRWMIQALRRRTAYYSAQKLQSSNSEVCGRWCLLRLYLRRLSDTQFARFVHRLARITGATPDMVAAAATI